MSRRNGYSLVELITVLGILSLLVLVSVPAFASMQRRQQLRAASAELRTIFQHSRMRAVTSGRNTGLRFFQVGSEWYFAVYEDRDGDGLRNDDITRGVDTMVEPPRVVFPSSRAITIGLLDRTIRDPDGDNLLPSQGPVHFNRSSLCSFSPMGESTPGTIYITDRGRDIWAVRVYGASAKIRVLRYDHGTRKWVS